MCFCDLVILVVRMKWLLSDVGYPVSPTPTCRVVVVLVVDLLESSWGGTAMLRAERNSHLTQMGD